MFIPRIPCTITKVGGHTVYGQELEGASYSELCNVVRLRKEHFHTTVRTDSSASRGHADEVRADVIVLLKPETKCSLGDKLTVGHLSIRVQNLNPKYSVMGRLHHWEAKGEVWE